MMNKNTVTFISTLVFIIAIAAAYKLGLDQRSVELYSCVYTYEKQGDYANARYYNRGIDCAKGSQNVSCLGELSYTGNYLATEKDVYKAVNSQNGVFYDGITINITT